jgi:steroid 5-alpha reductase family enzyme
MSKLKEYLIGILVPIICIGVNQLFAYLVTFSKTPIYSMYIIAFVTIFVQWVVFIHASGLFGNQRTEKYFDLTGSFTYLLTVLLTVLLVPQPSIRQIVVSSFACVWALRLGIFLFSRILISGEDRRFTAMKVHWLRFFQAWNVQGVWVFITLLSILIANQTVDKAPLNIPNYIGIGVWVFGFLFESIADQQKRSFRSDPLNANKWISKGLWSISRHPNYFGEIVLWIGIALITITDGPWWEILARFVSPIFVALLLIFISGIPLLEKHADEKFGAIEEYKRYKARTPVLVPIIGCRGNAMF